MWPFSKKKSMGMDLPPYPGKNDEEIELIPEELPPLETSIGKTSEMPMAKMISMPEKETMMSMMPMKEAPMKREMTPKRMIQEKTEKFISTSQFKSVLADVSEAMMTCDTVDHDVAKALEIKHERDERTGALQNTMEDIGKKLMLIDTTLFGG